MTAPTCDHAIVDSMARTLFVTAWAEAEEEAGRSHGGEDLMEVAPETPMEALFEAWRLTGRIEQMNGVGLWSLYARACVAQGDPGVAEGPNWQDTELQRVFGHYLVTESIGMGVAWTDDHAPFEITLPSYEPDIIREKVAEMMPPASLAP